MNKILQTFRYLMKSLSASMIIEVVVVLGTVAVTDLVFFLTSKYSMVNRDLSLTVPFEVVTGAFAMLIGMVLFIADFKVMLANGISRKTYMLATLLSAGTAAGAFATFNLLVMAVHGLFWPIVFITQLYYPTIGWAGVWISQFLLYFLLIMLGRMITSAYYRSSTWVRWAISLSPFVLFGVLAVANARSGGAVFWTIYSYHLASMRQDRAPWTLLAYAVILCGLVYLLIRRAPIRD